MSLLESFLDESHLHHRKLSSAPATLYKQSLCQIIVHSYYERTSRSKIVRGYWGICHSVTHHRRLNAPDSGQELTSWAAETSQRRAAISSQRFSLLSSVCYCTSEENQGFGLLCFSLTRSQTRSCGVPRNFQSGLRRLVV